MDINDIDAVLAVSGTLESHGYSDAAHTPGLLSDLFKWADGRASQFAAGHTSSRVQIEIPVVDKPKAKRGKATESHDSDTFESTPDPSDEPDF